MPKLLYAIVTPVRDEADNVKRLAHALAAQTALPSTWLVIDDGSRDNTADVVRSQAREHPWIRLESGVGTVLQRGGPIVRAFHAGLRSLEPLPEVVFKLDADITMGPDYFERLMDEFDRDPRLGIAGGSGYEKEADGVWRQRHGTGPAVWGACRGYRRECLKDILPLEERMGWDTLDLMKANMKGWKTEVFYNLPFQHHRVEGQRDRSRLWTKCVQGAAAHYMGYRFSYLIVRTMYRILREPAAIGLLLGYARAALRRDPQCADTALRAYVREQQGLRNLPRRVRETLRTRAPLVERAPN
jgi:glycosyltransferase involved in cell wall biosynthesis